MTSPGNRAPAVRNRSRSIRSWLLRERHAPVLDRLARRGGGLFVLAALALLAGWLLPDPRTLRAFLDDSEGPCLRIDWVARITTGEAEEPGPILLVQTEWVRDPEVPAPEDADACRTSQVLLRLPPLDDSIYRRQDGLLVPLRELAGPEPPRLPIPPELCLPAAYRSSLIPCQEAR